MFFNKILCNYCFPYLTTSPTCSEAGGADDLVSLLIYIRKSSCVVLFKESFKESYMELIISNFFLARVDQIPA